MATYFVWSGATGAGTGLSWTDACTSITALQTAVSLAGGDIVKVDKTHSVSASAAITWTAPKTGTGAVAFICVDRTNSDALADGAIEATNVNLSFTVKTSNAINTSLFVHGITLKTGTGINASGAGFALPDNSLGSFIFQDCLFWLNSTYTGTTSYVGLGSISNTSGGNRQTFYNCKFKFGSSTQFIYPERGVMRFFNCSIDGSGTAPTTIFSAAQGVFNLECNGCDWGASTNLVDVSGNAASATYRFYQCRIPSTVTTGTFSGYTGPEVEVVASGVTDATNGPNILNYSKVDNRGTIATSLTIYLTSGGGQGTQSSGTATSYSYSMTPSAECTAYSPLYTPWIPIKVLAAASKTISMNFADTESSAQTSAQLGIEVCYMGGGATANSPQNQLEVSAPTMTGTIFRDPTAAGTALSNTSAGWTGLTPTRTYTISKTVTTTEQGYIYVRGALYHQSTNPVYMDGKITVV